MSSFSSNVVILTGASSGIGRALARQLAAEGAWLALAARSRDELEEAVRECLAAGAGAGARAIAVPTDVSDEAQCRALVERTVAEYGKQLRGR